ncbi:MAG TPA: hypothetical protein VNK44_01625 [Candidatus Nitrosotenuis sp.]|nr:hypothetical protein [Candidatus Nitrosotenuis sp.]
MSQMLVGSPKRSVLYSEIYFPKKTCILRSTATEATCYFCKQELKEGFGLTAKKIGGKTVFVCRFHS